MPIWAKRSLWPHCRGWSESILFSVPCMLADPCEHVVFPLENLARKFHPDRCPGRWMPGPGQCRMVQQVFAESSPGFAVRCRLWTNKWEIIYTYIYIVKSMKFRNANWVENRLLLLNARLLQQRACFGIESEVIDWLHSHNVNLCVFSVGDTRLWNYCKAMTCVFAGPLLIKGPWPLSLVRLREKSCPWVPPVWYW